MTRGAVRLEYSRQRYVRYASGMFHSQNSRSVATRVGRVSILSSPSRVCPADFSPICAPNARDSKLALQLEHPHETNRPIPSKIRVVCNEMKRKGKRKNRRDAKDMSNCYKNSRGRRINSEDRFKPLPRSLTNYIPERSHRYITSRHTAAIFGHRSLASTATWLNYAGERENDVRGALEKIPRRD